MFLKYTVPVPVAAGKISRQKTKSGTYENSYLRERWSQTREHPRFLFT